MSKKIVSILLALTLVVSLAACSKPDTNADDNTKPEETLKIGLIQLVEHPALDDIREGFLDKMSELGYDDKVTIDYQNAQGDMATINSIAQKFVGDKVDLIVAIATSPAQSMVAATKDIPVIFSGITDPVKAALVKDLNAPGGNATGVSHAIPVDNIFNLADELTPGIKTYGFVYNSSEINALSIIDNAKAYLDSKGLKYEEVTISNTSELQQATQSLIGKVDAFFVPNDNTVASAMPILATEAIKAKLPVYTTADTLVYDGGLATVGVNYYEAGLITGEMVDEVLNGADTATMPVRFLSDLRVVVNEDTAKALNVDVSKYVEK